MGARSKRAQVVRKADEFDLTRLTQQLYMPKDGRTVLESWNLEQVLIARDEQMLGQFVMPSRLAEMMRTDDALYTAYNNRLAPQQCIPIEMLSAGGARGDLIAGEADALFGANGVGINEAVVNDIHGCLANHGVAFACCVATPRDDGSRIDIEAKYWPIEYMRWDPVFRIWKARADPNTVQPGDIPEDPQNEYGYIGGYWVPVFHGDGRWIIFKKHEIEPFRQNAAILPASMVWAAHAFAIRDWSQGSKAHGSAKVIGQLPEGVPLQNDGQATPEAAALVELLKAIARGYAPVGILPAKATLQFLTNNSTAWQVWSELALNREKAAARIYLGTDGTLGASGDAPGVDISELFGVAKTIVRSDLKAISRGFDTGLIQPWTAINFGDSRLAPSRRYMIPDDDEEQVVENYADRNAKFYEALKSAKDAGMKLSPQYVAELAADYKVRVPAYTPDEAAAPTPQGPAQ